MHGTESGHHHHGSSREGAMIFSVVLNIVITAAQVIGGLISGSLSLISDALHNLSDGLALVISLFALRISGKPNTAQKTFGYKRAEILAALFNASVLLVISFFLFKEAVVRFLHPSPIDGLLMLIVATVGLLANLLSVLLLHRGSRENLNIRTAYLHLLTDTFSSVAVIAGGIAILFFRIYWIDPLLTIGIGIYVLKESYEILIETVRILMQSAPAHLDVMEIQKSVERIPAVRNIHHIHVWNLNDQEIFFEGHVALSDIEKPEEIDGIRSSIERLLSDTYGITHTTIQLEYSCCTDESLIHNHDRHEHDEHTHD